MSKIPNQIATSNIVNFDAHKQQKLTDGGIFDALFNMGAKPSGNNGLDGFINDFVDNISSALNDDLGIPMPLDVSSPLYPFTSAFEDTFGIGGPLPAFINAMSSKLNLTAEQNLAFQEIAIRNKDITKTPENVQKLATELKAAGIGYKNT